MVLLDTTIDLVTIVDNVAKSTIASTKSGIGSQIATVARAVAGIAGMLFIAYHLVGQLVRNEAINFLPLLRPFAFVILISGLPGITKAIDTAASGLAVAADADTESVKVRMGQIMNCIKIQ